MTFITMLSLSYHLPLSVPPSPLSPYHLSLPFLPPSPCSMCLTTTQKRTYLPVWLTLVGSLATPMSSMACYVMGGQLSSSRAIQPTLMLVSECV